MKIIVNAKEVYWDRNPITYSELATMEGHHSSDILTIQYSLGPKDNPEGTLVLGQVVPIVDGMVFDVTITNNA